MATGAERSSPLAPGAGHLVGGDRRGAPGGAGHVVVVDDGFGWWPGVNAVELAAGGGRARDAS